jgi:hypothetical protein
MVEGHCWCHSHTEALHCCPEFVVWGQGLSWGKGQSRLDSTRVAVQLGICNQPKVRGQHWDILRSQA